MIAIIIIKMHKENNKYKFYNIFILSVYLQEMLYKTFIFSMLCTPLRQ